MDNPDVRAIGQIIDIHGDPLTIGIWHGHVNVAGRMLNEQQTERLAGLIVKAARLAMQDGGRHG